MKSKRFIQLLFVASFALCGCQNQNSDSANSETKFEKVAGKCVFDKLADYDAYIALRDGNETITIDSVPGLLIEKTDNDNELCFLWGRLGQEHRCIPYSLYVSDVNFDGYDDVCVMNLKGSGLISADITIYDFHNHTMIYGLEGRSEHRDYSFKIMDDDFVIVDSNSFLNTISRIGHFVNKKDKKVNVVWENKPFSITDIGVSIIHDDPDNYQIASRSKDYEDKIERYVIDSSLEWKLSFLLYYEGEITTNTKYVDDCVTFPQSEQYQISYLSYNPQGTISYNLKVLSKGLIDINAKVVDLDVVIHLDAR